MRHCLLVERMAGPRRCLAIQELPGGGRPSLTIVVRRTEAAQRHPRKTYVRRISKRSSTLLKQTSEYPTEDVDAEHV